MKKKSEFFSRKLDPFCSPRINDHSVHLFADLNVRRACVQARATRARAHAPVEMKDMSFLKVPVLGRTFYLNQNKSYDYFNVKMAMFVFSKSDFSRLRVQSGNFSVAIFQKISPRGGPFLTYGKLNVCRKAPHLPVLAAGSPKDFFEKSFKIRSRSF